MGIEREFLKGSISLLLLNLLSRGEMYGYEILQEASRRSENAFEFKEALSTPLCISWRRRVISRPSGAHLKTAEDVSTTRSHRRGRKRPGNTKNSGSISPERFPPS